jgi:hypothetical protein
MRDITVQKDKLLRPDWYLYFYNQLDEYFYHYDENKIGKEKEWSEKKKSIVETIIDSRLKNKIYLGDKGNDFDSERKKIDTIVIHSTSTNPENDYTNKIEYLDSLTLIRLYCREYSSKQRDYYGKPIYSGHYFNNKQVFIPYHYLIEKNGKIYHILKDKYIGWHAGNWDINCRSISIAFIGSFKDSEPTEIALLSARKIIQKYPNSKVIGHPEIVQTNCLGNNFLNNTQWKNKLI